MSTAVFLPVGSPEGTFDCPGGKAIDLVLHGYFFVNSDRTRVEWEDPSTAGADESRRLLLNWNHELFTEGTLPCVLPALDSFAKTSDLTEVELRNLSFGFRCSSLEMYRLVWPTPDDFLIQGSCRF